MSSSKLKNLFLLFCLAPLLIAPNAIAEESSPADESGNSANSQTEIAASKGPEASAVIAPAVRPQLPPVIASVSPEAMKKYRSFDELYEKGLEVGIPSLAQSFLKDAGGFRTKLQRYGLGLFFSSQNTFTYNLAQPPQTGPQSFIGGRPSGQNVTPMFLTYNIPSKNMQFVVSAIANVASWNAGMGPNTIRFYSLNYYQSFLNDKIQVKAGYLHNSQDFIGLQTGGSSAQGSLGAKGVLPYLAGLTATSASPGVNIRYKLPGNFYGKTGFQRSPDPVMFEDAKHDAVGLRFLRKGLGLLTIQEFGYRRAASPEAHQMWVRFGGMFNTTNYPRVDRPPLPVPTYMPNNWDIFFSADRQLIQFEKWLPFRGIYGGVSYQYNPPRQNVYSQVREVKLYAFGLFRNRPFDMASVVVANLDYSSHLESFLRAMNRPTYGDTTVVTGSYGFYVRPGLFFNAGIGYTRHVVPTPRIDNPLNLTLQTWMLF